MIRRLGLSDPWDLVTEIGGGPFLVRVIGKPADGEVWLLEPLEPVTIGGVEYRTAHVNARHPGARLEDSAQQDVYVHGAFYVPTTPERETPPEAGFIGTLRPADSAPPA